MLKPYIDAGIALIPLHGYNETNKKGASLAKVPMHKWLTRTFPTKDMEEHLAAGKNVGARLDATWLVVDVDPRNFTEGADSFKQLCADLHFDYNEYPVVHTGSGGMHIYMRKPEDIAVIDSHPDYPGVEFKTLGRFVVAAGSIHPNGKPYEWDLFALDLKDAKQAPVTLLNIARATTREANAYGGEGGQYTQEELADMLKGLDPHDFDSNEKWLPLMMACHHATAGAGRHEFLDWCMEDSRYAGQEQTILARWDSLTRTGQQGKVITHKTLLKHLSTNGKLDLVPVRLAETDHYPDMQLADISALATGDGEEELTPLEALNREFAMVTTAKGARVIRFMDALPGYDPNEDAFVINRWQHYTVGDFKAVYSSRARVATTTPGGKPTTKALTDVWLEWPGRRTYDAIVFQPGAKAKGNRLNLWSGWGVEPKKGDWSMLRDMLLKSLCAGDEKVFEYVLNWAANMIQNPGKPGQVAIAFRGRKGIGKGTFGNALLKLSGMHGLHISSSEALTGRFNGHLREKVFVFSDEAISSYDHKAQSALKALITEQHLSYESKGADIIQGNNCLHIMLASNYEAIVPAGMDGERRFLVQDAVDTWQVEGGSFPALYNQLNNGGYGALLFELMSRDLSQFDVYKIPMTEALAEQKIMHMSPIQQWWHDILLAGELPGKELFNNDWSNGNDARIFRQELLEDFSEFCLKRGFNPWGNGRGNPNAFTRQLNELAPGVNLWATNAIPGADQMHIRVGKNGRAAVSIVPPLFKCRRAFEANVGHPIDWQSLED